MGSRDTTLGISRVRSPRMSGARAACVVIPDWPASCRPRWTNLPGKRHTNVTRSALTASYGECSMWTDGPDGANDCGPRRKRVLDACPGVLAREAVKVDDRGARTGLPGSQAKRGDPVKCGARVALGVAGGYFLGRTKKMKLALALAGMAAGKRVGGPGQLLAQGTKLLGQSPELARLTDELRGRLLEAGKGAAVAVATRQVENLTERMVSRVGTLTETGGKTVSDAGHTVGGTVGEAGNSSDGLSRRESGNDGADDDQEYDEEYDEQPG